VYKLESLYELAFLRAFAAWEACLEGIFYRSLCGHSFITGREILVSGSYFSTIALAESSVIAQLKGAKATYLLWHNPTDVIKRCRMFIRSGKGFLALQEAILSSNQARLEYLSYVRHRIVHDNADSRRKFDKATLALLGRVYPNSRPGKFLRALDPSSPTRRKWLETFTAELVGLAGQMV
jgi:hypothetical protein